MRLTQASDHALRILILLAQADGGSTIDGVADRIGVPKSNVMKLVALLARAGHVESLRGRGGGIRLAPAAAGLTVGAVVRLTEPDLAVVDCLRSGDTGACCFLPACALKPAMARATAAFLGALDDVTVASIAARTQVPRLAAS